MLVLVYKHSTRVHYFIHTTINYKQKHIANGPFHIAGHMHNIQNPYFHLVPTNHEIFFQILEVDLKTRLSS